MAAEAAEAENSPLGLGKGQIFFVVGFCRVFQFFRCCFVICREHLFYKKPARGFRVCGFRVYRLLSKPVLKRLSWQQYPSTSVILKGPKGRACALIVYGLMRQVYGQGLAIGVRVRRARWFEFQCLTPR